jgi:hypothetical protein
MAFNQVSTGISIINTGHPGSIGLSLTNFTASAASNIAAGSAVEIAGAYFLADADVTPNASSWTSITTATTAYLTLTPSGTAGSQIVTASWISVPPTWDTAKQGWYTTAPSTIRVVASAYKAGATSYFNKRLLNNNQNSLQFDYLPTGSIIMYDGAGWVDDSILLGWYSCISANASKGCPDLVDRFILGKVVAGSGATGGSNLHTLSSAELPKHTHAVTYNALGGVPSSAPAGTNSGTGPNTYNTSDGGFANTAIDMHPAYYSVIYIRKCY